MNSSASPPPYEEWRTKMSDRAEDAAWLFGYYLIRHCRADALKNVPARSSPEEKEAINKAVDTALHNVMDLLEGFWKLPAGDGYTAEFALNVNIRRGSELVESVAISPAKLDLPIGYWAWCDAGG